MVRRNDNLGWIKKQVFTTGEAAEILGLSQQTIIRYFDSGRLHGFRVPGSRFRRILRTELLRFMKTNEIPTDVLDRMKKRILLVDDDELFVGFCRDLIGKDERFEVRTAATGYEAGMLTEQFRPHLILLDYLLPDINGHLVCQRIKANPELSDTKVLIISGVITHREIERLSSSGADGFLMKPFAAENLLSRVHDLLQLAPAE
ncbi:MAG: response regulator [Planctomycetota bacterium]|jgi:excisionase family DNA binding protein